VCSSKYELLPQVTESLFNQPMVFKVLNDGGLIDDDVATFTVCKILKEVYLDKQIYVKRFFSLIINIK